jgi:hypothetical protein
MCDPVSLGSLGSLLIGGGGAAATTIAGTSLTLSGLSTLATIGTSVMGFKAQSDQAEAEQEAANDAYILEQHLVNKRVIQEGEADAQKKADMGLKAARGEATGLASAAASGITGNSVDQVIGDFRRSEGINKARIDQSTEARVDQSRYELKGLRAKAQGRMNAASPPSVGDAFGIAVKSVGSFIGDVSDYRDLYDEEL